MSLNQFAQENNSSNNNQGNNNMKGVETNPLYALLSQTNLISSTNNTPEVKDVMDLLDETVKHLKKNTATEEQKLGLPADIQSVTSDISPQLPGITLSTVLGSVCYVMPVLFFKSGITEVTESIYLQNEQMPRGIAKVATSFMNHELMEKVVANHNFRNGKQMSKVIIVSPMVINLETYIKNSLKYEDVIGDVTTNILKEWTTGLYNMVGLDLGKAGLPFPSLFKEGKLFGKDDSAVARVEPVNKLTIDGKMSPYNLAIKLSTTNKNNTQNVNSNNTRSIATAYATVSLEAMAPQQFMQARAANPTRVVGPLVPVIATGQCAPGETLNNNNSMITALLGVYASIGANQIQFFSEAFRSREVGHRGNIGNFNHFLSQILGGLFKTENYITDKNIANAQSVNNWLQNYVAPNAVYVMDLANFSEDVSNSDFWWNIVAKQSGSTYHRTLVALMDALSNNAFSTLIATNAQKGGSRDSRKDWVLGDPILIPTQVTMPTGIAQGKDGKWFDLAEVDGMFLRGENYYGQNEAAVNEYLSLVNGHTPGELKVRQFNIYNRLNQLFSSAVIVDGWKRRFVWSDAFLNTMASAMAASGSMSMSSPGMSAMWSIQHSNDYLNWTATAGLSVQAQVGNMGMGGGYTHY